MSSVAQTPVFPLPPQATHQGIGLRDWLATMALQGLLAKGIEVNSTRLMTQEDRETEMAQRAFRMADAMLRARELPAASSTPPRPEAVPAES